MSKNFERNLIIADANSVYNFSRLSLHYSIPVLIKAAAVDWPAYKKWNFRYFKSNLGSKKVKIAKSHEAIFLPPTKGDVSEEECSLEQAIDLILDNHDNCHYYIMQKSIKYYFQEILNDFSLLDWMDKKNAYHPNLWIGGKNNVSPLHFDMSYNYLTQISGKKHIRLFSPNTTTKLNPYRDASFSHYSKYVTLDSVQYPHISCYEFTLEPGDIIYIPPGWWHQVHSLDNAVSINFWWAPKLLHSVQIESCLYKIITCLLDGDFSIIGNFEDFVNKKDLSSQCNYLIKINCLDIAAILLVNYFQFKKINEPIFNEEISYFSKMIDNFSHQKEVAELLGRPVFPQDIVKPFLLKGLRLLNQGEKINEFF